MPIAKFVSACLLALAIAWPEESTEGSNRLTVGSYGRDNQPGGDR